LSAGVYPKFTPERRIELETNIVRFDAELEECREQMADANARKSRPSIMAVAIPFPVVEQDLPASFPI
jgi:hypothetical protein